MRAEKRLSLGDLSLTTKVTLTLGLGFVAALGLFLAALVPLEREQHGRLLEQNKRLLSTLRDKYQRDFIHDIVSESGESTVIDMADMARQQGILWVGLEAGSDSLAATADSATIERLLGGSPAIKASSAEAAVLVIGPNGRGSLIGPGGRRLAEGREIRDALPVAGFPRASSQEPFREVPWGRETALHSVAPLRAADETFGDLSLVYSLAELHRSEALTRRTFYGVLAASFALLVLLVNLLLSRIVLAPVRRVMDAMRQASRGELRVRLPVHSRDELGSMAESFNVMVSELEIAKRGIEDYSRNLEAMVGERTRELRASEETLITVKNHLATVIANVATGVVSLDESGRVTTFNGRAGEILGVAAEDAIGRPITELLADGERRRLLEFVDGACQGGREARQGQVQMKLAQGTHTLSVVASPLVGEADRVLGTVIVFDDLTQILATQRLSAWKEAVERVIHEIKNPLTPVGLSAQTLLTAFEHDRARFDQMFPSAVQMILDSVRDLRALIGEFTQFSRLPEVVRQRLDANDVIREAVAPYAAGEGVRLRTALADTPLLVDADRPQLRRVLLNVINNGVEALAGRPGEIVVSSAAADDGRSVTLTVRDEGCGVEDVERIFEPYYTTKVKGTGLGLAIARQIVEEHGGAIRAESRLDAGTTIVIRLPAAR